MPLLSDSKTCYVGTQPITKIYAGTQLVWGAVQLRVVIVYPTSASGQLIAAEFAERENCADCADMKRVYQWRYEQAPGVWIAWEPFSGWTVGTNDPNAYQFLGMYPGDSGRFNNNKLQLRTNGKVQEIIMNVTNAPNLGSITPELTCS